MRYRRSLAEGGTFFFTVNLANRNSRLLTEYIDDLRTITRTVRQRRPFEIIAMVVLPDHLHAVWEMPDGDARYPMRWSTFAARGRRPMENDDSIAILGISFVAVCGSVVSLLAVMWYLAKVLSHLRKPLPVVAFFLGPFVMTNRFVDDKGKPYVMKLMGWAVLLALGLLAIRLFYPFPADW